MNEKKSAYLIGVKGVGMTGLALYLKQAGFDVSGSDTPANFKTSEILTKNQIPVSDGFNKENIQSIKPDYVIVSAAYGLDNPEVKEAYRRRLNTIYYSQALGMITAHKKVIAVAGVHGKTTTTTMIAELLTAAEMFPSYLIGVAEAGKLGANAKKGEGEYFVLEADEYRQSPANNESKFLDINPEIAVISSIELDHPDIFPTIEEVYSAFYRFACRVPRNGKIILCVDYPKCRKLKTSLADRNFETYGFNESDWQIVDLKEGEITEFNIKHGKEIIGPFKIGLPGKANALNAVATIVLADILGISIEITKKVLAQFSGVNRRFEKVGEVNDIVIYDDYAHHPTAVAKTLEAAKLKFKDAKIWVIFQPHTFSRTKSLLKEFGSAFSSADKVIIADIFTSEREKEGNVTSKDLAEEIGKNHKNVRYLDSPEKIKNYLLNSVAGKAVIFTMGAGDIYKLGQELLPVFKNKSGGTNG